MRETSKMIRQKYIDDVLGPLPEPQKTMMTQSFDSGIAVGIIAGAEVVYAAVDELKSNALLILKGKAEGGEKSDSTKN